MISIFVVLGLIFAPLLAAGEVHGAAPGKKLVIAYAAMKIGRAHV